MPITQKMESLKRQVSFEGCVCLFGWNLTTHCVASILLDNQLPLPDNQLQMNPANENLEMTSKDIGFPGIAMILLPF